MSDGTPLSFLGPETASPAVPARDTLRYIADMLDELEDMAKRQRCDGLAAMLSLSAVEARRQADAGPESP